MEEKQEEMTAFESIAQHWADAKSKIMAPAKQAFENYKIRQDREEQAKRDLELRAKAIERLFNAPEFKVFQEFATELSQEMTKYWMLGGEKDYSTAAWLLNELKERPRNVLKLSEELKENTRV